MSHTVADPTQPKPIRNPHARPTHGLAAAKRAKTPRCGNAESGEGAGEESTADPTPDQSQVSKASVLKIPYQCVISTETLSAVAKTRGGAGFARGI